MTLARAASMWHLEPGKARDGTHGGVGPRSLRKCHVQGGDTRGDARGDTRGRVARVNGWAAGKPRQRLASLGSGWQASAAGGKPRQRTASTDPESSLTEVTTSPFASPEAFAAASSGLKNFLVTSGKEVTMREPT